MTNIQNLKVQLGNAISQLKETQSEVNRLENLIKQEERKSWLESHKYRDLVFDYECDSADTTVEMIPIKLTWYGFDVEAQNNDIYCFYWNEFEDEHNIDLNTDNGGCYPIDELPKDLVKNIIKTLLNDA